MNSDLKAQRQMQTLLTNSMLVVVLTFTGMLSNAVGDEGTQVCRTVRLLKSRQEKRVRLKPLVNVAEVELSRSDADLVVRRMTAFLQKHTIEVSKDADEACFEIRFLLLGDVSDPDVRMVLQILAGRGSELAT
ncbi:MAG: hypothetical protein KDA89_22505, partial [Planctomycetaceae bacterium]|nr:hypothetical protein [Planctomycetaceae bacterium]